ncbi:MAG TPA: CAP domain-containing protein [Candidatus Acidoferrales bacterium]
MRLASISAVMCAAILMFSPRVARGQESGAVQTLFESANRERIAHGLAPFKWSATLAVAARQHAQRMAARNTLSHQLPGEPGMAERATQAGARFSSLAENVAEGPSAESLHRQWMNSPPHRANLLDPQLDSIGIAVAERNGVLFAVEDFSLAAGTLSVEEQEGIVGAKLISRGLQLRNFTSDARRSCALDNGYAGSHVPSFVLHYATADLQTLPDLLEQRIQTGKYHSAVVGACPSDAKIGLSNYRIAVLLFE